jgi:hypothetical protein
MSIKYITLPILSDQYAIFNTLSPLVKPDSTASPIGFISLDIALYCFILRLASLAERQSN